MRRFFKWLLRGLVLFVVFVASALTAMRFAIHGRQTTIPKVVGLSKSQAERLLADHGLVLDEGDRYFSSDVPPGRVMSQAPQPGLKVRRGWSVRVAESMGPQRVVIPDLVGTSERAAEINIRKRGLELGSIATATIPGAPSDQIVGQSPPANAVNVSEPKISLLLAASEERASFVMPDLVGQSEDAAVNVIVNAGLRVSGIKSQSAPAPAPTPNPTAPSNPPATPQLSPPTAPQANSPETAPSGTRMVVHTYPAAGQRVFEGQGIGLEVTQ
ncbi:MAG: PASTA domain-containing protein [Candidatus Korobacteraceae bacterium]